MLCHFRYELSIKKVKSIAANDKTKKTIIGNRENVKTNENDYNNLLQSEYNPSQTKIPIINIKKDNVLKNKCEAEITNEEIILNCEDPSDKEQDEEYSICYDKVIFAPKQEKNI